MISRHSIKAGRGPCRHLRLTCANIRVPLSVAQSLPAHMGTSAQKATESAARAAFEL